jgi:Tfp pilus assembly protein PilF
MGLRIVIKGKLILAFAWMLLIAPAAMAQGNGDTTSVEYWRQKGFEAHQNGNVELSLQYYRKILSVDRDDWDANLAVARIFFEKADYSNALGHYRSAHAIDSTNEETNWNIGRCHYRMGNFKEAVVWYRKALQYLPSHPPLLEDLSYALVNSNQQDQALKVYQELLAADPSSAIALAGLGKIYLITGKPALALRHLKKALELEPGNKDYELLARQAKNQLAFTLSYQFMYINEQEPIDLGNDTAAYNINALLHSISLSKRVSDRLSLRFSHLLDRSNREYYLQETEQRWYDNTALRATLLLDKHKVHIFAGGSKVEEKLTGYGIAWDYARNFGKLRFSNTLTAGYDYYYYWNQVGHDFIADQLRVGFGKFTLDANYRYVNVRELYLIDLDTIGRNPGHQYTLTAKYTFLKNPKITLGYSHNYRDYQYKSPRYWSPQDRRLNTGMATIYWESPKGLYAWASANVGRASDGIDHWEASGELGYNRKTMSYAAGAARFYNPWYENFIAYIAVTKRFVK